MEKNNSPFLRWPGGKRWLSDRDSNLFPVRYNRYIEPFLGGGAIFFHIAPSKSILADINGELIETYQAVKANWRLVYRHLREHHFNHSADYYYEIRDFRPRTIYSRAARMIYLNRTCWNGVYRVNRQGQFNVPIGTKTDVLLDTEFESISNALKHSKLIVSDFESIISKAKRGDLIFADPPYTVKHDNNGFIKYNDKLFSWKDQLRLRDCLLAAKKRGSKIICTNANHHSIRKIYRDYFCINKIGRNSLIASKNKFRGSCNELIICS